MDSVFTIDCNYVRPRVAAAYLIIEGDRAAFVENNTTHAVPLMLDALRAHGMEPEQVEYAIITHVHLDHAGGSSALLKACPNATLLAHPRAARHVIDPSRLIRSSVMVYGEEPFRELYGEIEPVAADRVRTMADGEELRFGNRTLTFFFTRGHANHHFCIHDSGTNGVFTGDSFGLAYPDLQVGSRPLLYPSTTPTDFHAEEARLSVRRILETGADRAYLTHFDAFEHMQEGADQMLRGLDVMEEILDAASESGEQGDPLRRFCEDRINDAVDRPAHRCVVSARIAFEPIWTESWPTGVWPWTVPAVSSWISTSS